MSLSGTPSAAQQIGLPSIHEHRCGRILHHRVGHAAQEVLLRAPSAPRTDGDEIGLLTRGQLDQFGAGRTGQYHCVRGKPCLP